MGNARKLGYVAYWKANIFASSIIDLLSDSRQLIRVRLLTNWYLPHLTPYYATFVHQPAPFIVT